MRSKFQKQSALKLVDRTILHEHGHNTQPLRVEVGSRVCLGVHTRDILKEECAKLKITEIDDFAAFPLTSSPALKLLSSLLFNKNYVNVTHRCIHFSRRDHDLIFFKIFNIRADETHVRIKKIIFYYTG